MNKLSTQRRMQIVAALVEGAGVNSVSRMTGVSNNTVLKLLADLGQACADYQDRVLRNLSCKRIQCDEIWIFCYAKAKNLPEELKGRFGFGDVWTWTAIRADTKLIPCWLVGERNATYAIKFIADLASRLAHRVQLTTDGHRPYLTAVEAAFGADIDYSTLIKLYSNPPTGNETRYSPGVCCGTQKMRIKGNPDAAHVSISYAERHNLQMRMSMRRFTRLTNAHSKNDSEPYSCYCYVHDVLQLLPHSSDASRNSGYGGRGK